MFPPRTSFLLAPMVLWLGRDPAATPRATIPLTLTLAASSVVGGNSTTATVTVSVAAPAGGDTIIVSNPPGTTVQAGAAQIGIIQSIGTTKIAIAAGARSVTFRINTGGVATTTTAVFTARSGADVASATLSVTPAVIRAVTMTPSRVTGGQSSSLTIAFDGASPGRTGTAVQLSVTASSGDGSALTDPVAVSVPATVQVPPGASSITVALTTTPVATTQRIAISASLGGSQIAASLTVQAPFVTALTLNPSTVVAGNSTAGTVTLSGAAPSAGVIVPLAASSTSAKVPASVTVSSGSTAAVFKVTTATAGSASTMTIGALRSAIREAGTRTTISDGSSNTIMTSPGISAVLTLLPTPVLGSISVSPTPVVPGAPLTLSLSFLIPLQTSPTGTVPPGVIAGAAQIVVDQPTLVRLPTTVTIPASPTVVNVGGGANVPSVDQNVTVTVTFGPTTKSLTLLLRAPVPPPR